MKHIIANNALTAIAACASSILFVGAPGAYHVIPGLLISKLYIVSLMASRKSSSASSARPSFDRTASLTCAAHEVNSRARLSENLNATRAQGRAYTSGVGSAFDGSAVDRSPDSPKRSRSHMHGSASMRSYNNHNVSYSQDLPIQVTVYVLSFPPSFRRTAAHVDSILLSQRFDQRPLYRGSLGV